MKKLSLILAFVILFATMAGCTNNQGNDFDIASKEELNPEKIGYYSTLKLPIDDKNTEISIMVSSTYSEMNDSVVIKELRRRTGLNVQLLIIPTSTYSQKAKVMLASGDSMPDAFKFGDIKAVNDVADQGAFEAISDHLDELPNFKEIFYTDYEKYGLTENSVKNYLSGDGKLYMFLNYGKARDVNHGFLYRKDIFDKNGIDMWTSPEEFVEVLRTLKKQYPESTPYVSKTGSHIFRDMGYQWGLKGFLQYFDETDGVWKMSSTDSKYKKMLDMLKLMYNEKLVDPEFLTATQAAWTQKMTQSDKAFVTWDWIGRLDMFKDQTKQTIPDYDLRYAPPLNKKVITLSKVDEGCSFKKSDKTLLAMKLFDYLISESGARLMTLGVENETYTMGEDGFADYIGFDNNKAIGITELEDKYGMFVEKLCVRFDKKSTYFNYSEKEQEAQDMMNNMQGGGYWPVDPVLNFTAEELEEVTTLQVAYEKAAEEFSVKFILNESAGDKEWQEWLNKAKTLGSDRIVEIYNKAQKRYNAM